MKLLVDNQLPAALARYLSEKGFDCQYVQDIGMEASDDRAIWERAKSEQMVIVTKDEDGGSANWSITPSCLGQNRQLQEGRAARNLLCHSARLTQPPRGGEERRRDSLKD